MNVIKIILFFFPFTFSATTHAELQTGCPKSQDNRVKELEQEMEKNRQAIQDEKNFFASRGEVLPNSPREKISQILIAAYNNNYPKMTNDSEKIVLAIDFSKFKDELGNYFWFFCKDEKIPYTYGEIFENLYRAMDPVGHYAYKGDTKIQDYITTLKESLDRQLIPSCE